MRFSKWILAFLIIFTAAACSGEAETDTSKDAGAKASNKYCPLMTDEGHEVDPAVPMVDYDGKKVGFCCPKCIPKFEKLSDEDKKKALAKAN